MTACAVRKDSIVPTKTHVVPANAGTHNHRWLLLGELLPQVADTFLITITECMGPGVRQDDVENFVRSFVQASVIAARKPLRVNGGFRNLPREEKREAERRKAHLGNGRGLFPGSPGNRGTRQRLSTFRPGDLLASARPSKAQEASQRPADHDGFPAVTCTSPSHLVAGPHSGAGRGPKASRVRGLRLPPPAGAAPIPTFQSVPGNAPSRTR